MWASNPWGNLPLSDITLIDSPLARLCPVLIVYFAGLTLVTGFEWSAVYDFSEVFVVAVNAPLDITTDASYGVAPARYNFSPTLAPILNPWAIADGGENLFLFPSRYKRPGKGAVLLGELSIWVVAVLSIWSQSIASSLVTIALGVTIEVTNPLLSLSNASFLNPSAQRANWPKLELELVTEASAPDNILKWVWYPIANTETICITASLETFTWVVSYSGL